MVIMGKTTMRAHPCVSVEKQAFKNFLQGMRLLGIKDTEAKPNKGGRPLIDQGMALV
jgi:hypothetical protein